MFSIAIDGDRDLHYNTGNGLGGVCEPALTETSRVAVRQTDDDLWDQAVVQGIKKSIYGVGGGSVGGLLTYGITRKVSMGVGVLA